MRAISQAGPVYDEAHQRRVYLSVLTFSVQWGAVTVTVARSRRKPFKVLQEALNWIRRYHDGIAPERTQRLTMSAGRNNAWRSCAPPKKGETEKHFVMAMGGSLTFCITQILSSIQSSTLTMSWQRWGDWFCFTCQGDAPIWQNAPIRLDHIFIGSNDIQCMHLQIVQSLFQAWRCRMKRSIKPQKHIDRWQAAKLQHVTHRELIDSASRCHAGHGWTLQLAGGSKERSGTLKTSENEIGNTTGTIPVVQVVCDLGNRPNSQTNIQLYRRTRKGV